LHEFFERWFNGTLENTDTEFARFTTVLHPDFSMVAPAGETLDRDTVLQLVREAHASSDVAAPLRIEIHNVVNRAVSGDGALVTYEEWQFAGDRLHNRRTSTAYFLRAPATPAGVVWRHLHESLHETAVGSG
jgi:hypothetical protein